jgi:hypothetical protein
LPNFSLILNLKGIPGKYFPELLNFVSLMELIKTKPSLDDVDTIISEFKLKCFLKFLKIISGLFLAKILTLSMCFSHSLIDSTTAKSPHLLLNTFPPHFLI